MATDRQSPAQRIQAQIVAEREINRFDDHARWHKHVHNVELDPMQCLKMEAMDAHDNTVDVSCRRTGKTANKELWGMEFLARTPDQECGIVAPREAQAIVNLNYHLEAIRRSPILTAYLNNIRGRTQMSDTRYQFANRSKAASYGIMAQVDGGDLTLASLEEVDDMPADRLYGRFLLMLAGTRRLGASKASQNKPRIRITGVFKGADTLGKMIETGGYHLLDTVDAYLGVQMGILDAQFVAKMREELSPDDYIRQLLCKNVASTNLVWQRWVQAAIQRGIRVGLSIVEPVFGERYRKRGLISFGYDAGGHGEDPAASKHALVVLEEIQGYDVPIFVKTWPAAQDDAAVKEDLKAFWRYFRPDYAMGDAYGVGMLTQLNDELFAEGLTHINRQAIGEGQSSASQWPDWAFSPIRFDGMTKHIMCQLVRSRFQNDKTALPAVNLTSTEPAERDMKTLQDQLPNIVPEATKKSYSSYKMAHRKVGDDTFDAYCAALFALRSRGAGVAKTSVHVHTEDPAAALLPYDTPMLEALEA